MLTAAQQAHQNTDEIRALINAADTGAQLMREVRPEVRHVPPQGGPTPGAAL